MAYERDLADLKKQLDSLNDELYSHDGLSIDEIQELNYQINKIYQEMALCVEEPHI